MLQFTGVVITMFGVLCFYCFCYTDEGELESRCAKKEEKTNLVTTGIYSISRNPAFLGFDLMYIGILFSFFNWFLYFATGFAVVFFSFTDSQCRGRLLIEAFGNEYLQYKSKSMPIFRKKKDKFQFAVLIPAGFGAGTPQQEHFKNAGALQKCSPGWARNFQELKICGHGTILALPFFAAFRNFSHFNLLADC